MSIFSIRLYLEPNPGGVYTVTSPDVPGLVTEGRTPDEIQRNVQDALDALQEAWRELGLEIPPVLRPAWADRRKPPDAGRRCCGRCRCRHSVHRENDSQRPSSIA